MRPDEAFRGEPAVDDAPTTWALVRARNTSGEPFDERIVMLVHSQAVAREITSVVRASRGRPLEVVEVALGTDGRYSQVSPASNVRR